MRKVYILLLLTTIISLGTLIYSFTITVAPSEMRDRKFDEKRAKDIISINNSISSYYATHQRLPEALTELSNEYGDLSLKDPETNQPYEYTKKNDGVYTLCTTYKTELKEEKNSIYSMNNPHAKGRVCKDSDMGIGGGGGYNYGYETVPQESCSGYYCGACKQNECGNGKKSGGGCTWDTAGNYCTEQNAGASNGEACYDNYQCKSNMCQGSICVPNAAISSPVSSSSGSLL